MYRVIRHFTDLKDKNHKYVEGDTYPRDGYEPSDKRIAELSGTSNKQGVPLIQKVQKAQKKRKE